MIESGNVECRTAHSIAFAAVGRKYRHRLDAPRLPARETTRLLGITGDFHADVDKITRFHQARLVMGMIKRYCYSSATEVMARHMEAVNGPKSSPFSTRASRSRYPLAATS